MHKEQNEITIRSSAAEYLTYVAATGDNKQSIEMRYEDENIWLTQKMMAVLYDISVAAINQHIKKIFDDHELEPDSVIKKYLITAADGKNYDTNHYNLQMIIAVGFKVNNERAVQFRKWANRIVKDYTIQGWVMDEERLKHGGTILTEDYFERQLEKIREIRLSERRFYQKITDIYSTALDYDKTAKATRDFFSKVQNKLHFAVHGNTAAEIIYNRADAQKQYMGLTTWSEAPDGKIQRSDVVAAKNYLSAEEMQSLELIVSAYLDLAERRARARVPMTMSDWAKHLDLILQADGNELLTNAGKISAQIAEDRALSEFEKYRVIQDKLFESDYDRFAASLQRLEKKSSVKKKRKTSCKVP
ncbi:MAG: virulence RhuM family protein [Treponema sp.]|jgi:hypothetical protein|nr:virulence RhuM family protein [Treponema sp.]